MLRSNHFRLFVFALLGILALAGCAQAPAPAVTSAPAPTSAPIVQTQVVPQTQVVEKVVTATPPPEATAAPKPKGKITVWMWKATQDSIVNPGVVKDFNAEYPDVQVEWVTYNPADVYQKLPLALSAGTGAPDVAYVEDSHLSKFVALGGLADLTDRVKPYLDKMNAYKWPAGQKDGKYYSMPLDSGPVVLYYRRDLFKAAGLPDDPQKVSELIKTWDDYLGACKTIKEKVGVPCFPASKAKNSARLYEMMLWQQGLGYYDSKGDVTVDSPENIATLEKLGEFWKNDLTYDEEEWTQPWYDGFSAIAPDAAPKPVASFVEAAWMGVFFKTWIAPGTAGKWGVALMPTLKPSQVRASNDGGSSFVIPEQSQNKDAAWAFIEFLTARAREQNKIFAYGDIFPALEEAYNDPLYVEPDSFFGGQQTRQTYVDVVKQIPSAYVYGPNYQEMNGFVQTAIQKYATGAASASDALKEAAAAIRQQVGSQ
jgi:lactose/L-arabinose transport system substrate-binding protein